MGQVINTHQLFNKLRENGFDEKQAEAVLDTIETIQNAKLEEVATKADIMEIKAEISQIHEELKGDMKVLQWGVGILVLSVLIPLVKDLFS